MTEKSGFPRVHHTPSQQQNFSSDLKAEKARAREEDLSELLMVKEEEVCGFARKLTPVRLAMRRRAHLFSAARALCFYRTRRSTDCNGGSSA